jgi:hypothetical protein
MMHARRDDADGWKRRQQRGRPAGWPFALLVMCLAVLPHVALAACVTPMPVPSHAHPAAATPAPAIERDRALAPRHPASSVEHTASAKPPCCGQITDAPMASLLLEQAIWSRVSPPVITSIQGRSTEPAEPPPRSVRRS